MIIHILNLSKKNASDEVFILRAGFEPARSNANDIDRVMRVIPSLHQKKYSEVINFKGYSPTDLNQLP